MYRDEALNIAAGLCVQADDLEKQAKTLRSTAAKLRHPNNIGNLPERP